jgi:hypothetical protein
MQLRQSSSIGLFLSALSSSVDRHRFDADQDPDCLDVDPDPDCFDAYPDPDCFDAYPDPDCFDADPDPDCFDADPDPTFHFDTDPDPTPNLHLLEKQNFFLTSPYQCQRCIFSRQCQRCHNFQ